VKTDKIALMDKPHWEVVRSACLPIATSNATASSFLLSRTGAITAAHVLNDNATSHVELITGGMRRSAMVENLGESSDTALLRLDQPIDGVQPLPFSFDARPGDDAYIYGFSRHLPEVGLGFEVRIQDTHAKIPGSERPRLVLSLPANVHAEELIGFSGAPVVVRGAVVGFVSQIVRGFDGILAATRIQDALEILSPQEYARAQHRVESTDRSVGRFRGEAEGAKVETIAVCAALDEELDYLLEKPFGWSAPRIIADGLTYREGEYGDHVKIIAASANSMGLIPTAILTTKVLREWCPYLVAMIGVCGGRKEKGVFLGDVVVPTQSFHYQFGSYRDGKIQRELRVENTDQQLLDMVAHVGRRTDALLRIKQALPRSAAKPRHDLQCHTGPMASADLVVKDVEKFGEAIEADRKTIAVEMESYAFMRAASLARTRWTLVAKSVSDYADEAKADDFREYAKYTSTEFFLEVTRSLLTSGHLA
jgi:nucleoside phosphorylase